MSGTSSIAKFSKSLSEDAFDNVGAADRQLIVFLLMVVA